MMSLLLAELNITATLSVLETTQQWRSNKGEEQPQLEKNTTTTTTHIKEAYISNQPFILATATTRPTNSSATKARRWIDGWLGRQILDRQTDTYLDRQMTSSWVGHSTHEHVLSTKWQHCNCAQCFVLRSMGRKGKNVTCKRRFSYLYNG